MTTKITQVKNKQEFKIIVMPALAQHTLFEKFHCDLCEEPTAIEKNVYYEAVIDSFFCERCHKLYLDTAVRYQIDDKHESLNYEKIKLKLEQAGWFNQSILD